MWNLSFMWYQNTIIILIIFHTYFIIIVVYTTNISIAFYPMIITLWMNLFLWYCDSAVTSERFMVGVTCWNTIVNYIGYLLTITYYDIWHFAAIIWQCAFKLCQRRKRSNTARPYINTKFNLGLFADGRDHLSVKVDAFM